MDVYYVWTKGFQKNRRDVTIYGRNGYLIRRDQISQQHRMNLGTLCADDKMFWRQKGTVTLTKHPSCVRGTRKILGRYICLGDRMSQGQNITVDVYFRSNCQSEAPWVDGSVKIG